MSVWALPLLALLGGGVVVWRAVRRWVRQGGAITAPAISPATPQEELRYLSALADFDDADLMSRVLAMSITDDVRTQNAPYLLRRPQ